MSSFYKPSLEMADLFNQYGHLLGNLPRQHRKVIQDIKNCRTSILGGHKMKCDSCEFEKNSYNSCRNRHCPKCQFLTQVKWIEKRSEDLLPCRYFHVVFTLPSELNPLILQNKKLLYNILFRASSETLKEVAKNPDNLGAEIGCIGILHTWTQDLRFHPHIHFIVPGGGLSSDESKWMNCKEGYLLNVQVLSEVFRGKFLQALENSYEKLRLNGNLQVLQNFSNFKDLLMKSAHHKWVVYSKEPFAGPAQVIKYLGQYTHRIAISNWRLLKLEGEMVHFKVRDNQNRGRKKIKILHVRNFLRRYLLHIVPKRYVRIRHFGLLGSRMKKVKIALIRKLTSVIKSVKIDIHVNWKDLLKNIRGIDVGLCPKCKKGSLIEVGRLWPMLGT